MKIFLKKGDGFQEITVSKKGPEHYCGAYGKHNHTYTEVGKVRRKVSRRKLVGLYAYEGGFLGHSCGRSGMCKPHPTAKADLALDIFGILEADHAPKDATILVVDAKVKDSETGYTREMAVAFYRE